MLYIYIKNILRIGSYGNTILVIIIREDIYRQVIFENITIHHDGKSHVYVRKERSKQREQQVLSLE